MQFGMCQPPLQEFVSFPWDSIARRVAVSLSVFQWKYLMSLNLIVVQSFEQFEAYGLVNKLGMIINVSVVKQIGPVLAAVMVAG